MESNMCEVDKLTLQKIELSILNYVVDFCDKHNINYFLVGGTLLGAVKYKGFIPWDDDVDIGMLRDEYERFIQLFNAEQSDFYLYYNHAGNKNCCHSFVKICLKDTKVKDCDHDKENFGIYIDLFPFDSFKDCERGKILFSKFSFIRSLMGMKSRSISFNSVRNTIKSLIAICLFPISNYYFNLLLQYLIKKERRDDGLVALIAGGKRNFTAHPKHYFTNLKKIEFAGRQYKVLADSDRILKDIYGEHYMEPVSQEKQTHHNYKVYASQKVKDNFLKLTI